MPSRAAGQSFFWNDGDNMGVVPEAAQQEHGGQPDANLPEAAAAVLMKILKERGSASGDEELVFANANTFPGSDTTHLRFHEAIRGMPVDGTSLLMHIRTTDGVVYAVNGEFVNSRDVTFPSDGAAGDEMGCEKATRVALLESGIANGEWELDPPSTDEGDGEESNDSTECGTQAIATDPRGRAHVCWKRSVRYGGFHRDVLYASAITGELVARIPQVMTSGGHGGIEGGSGGVTGGFAGGV
jgi:Fungalysin/Thermolysin Propeptide Motif